MRKCILFLTCISIILSFSSCVRLNPEIINYIPVIGQSETINNTEYIRESNDLTLQASENVLLPVSAANAIPLPSGNDGWLRESSETGVLKSHILGTGRNAYIFAYTERIDRETCSGDLGEVYITDVQDVKDYVIPTFMNEVERSLKKSCTNVTSGAFDGLDYNGERVSFFSGSTYIDGVEYMFRGFGMYKNNTVIFVSALDYTKGRKYYKKLESKITYIARYCASDKFVC